MNILHPSELKDEVNLWRMFAEIESELNKLRERISELEKK